MLGCGRTGRGPHGLLPSALLFIPSAILARTPPFTGCLLLPDPEELPNVHSHLVAPEGKEGSVKAPSGAPFWGGGLGTWE